MAFWGIEIKPGKPYVHQNEEKGGRLHVSQATLVTGSSTKKSIVQCNVGDTRPTYLCSLLPEKLETCPLNLEFEEDDEVIFSVIGSDIVHLSGFFCCESQGKFGDDDVSDSYEEVYGETASESDESADYDTEDEFGDYFSDDDFDPHPPSPVPNIGVKIEEILDDEKPANENGMAKQPTKKKNWLNGSEGNDNSQQQIVAKSGIAVPVLESEDEDGFPLSSPHKSTADVLNTKTKEIKNKRTGEEARKKKAKNALDHTETLKRKIDAVAQDDEQSMRNVQAFDSAVPSTDVVPGNDVKQKKISKKKARGEEEKAQLEAITRDMDQAPPDEKEYNLTDRSGIDIGADSTTDENRSKETEKKKKKKKNKNKNKNKQQESSVDANMEQTVTEKNGSTKDVGEQTEAKPFQVRSFPNGLVIEELEMGKPDGKRASPGKKVSVHYIGKLKKNGKIFDSNIGRAPFKFRLGVGQVIKGWDVGVKGMRVGDKRRLTIPPAMGYGAKGAGGAIPPNSWLVFDVELVDVS